VSVVVFRREEYVRGGPAGGVTFPVGNGTAVGEAIASDADTRRGGASNQKVVDGLHRGVTKECLRVTGRGDDASPSVDNECRVAPIRREPEEYVSMARGDPTGGAGEEAYQKRNNKREKWSESGEATGVGEDPAHEEGNDHPRGLSCLFPDDVGNADEI